MKMFRCPVSPTRLAKLILDSIMLRFKNQIRSYEALNRQTVNIDYLLKAPGVTLIGLAANNNKSKFT